MGGRSLHKLTAIQAAKLNAPGRHSDGGGLYLSIDDTGRRRWVFIYTRGARRTELGLGGGRDLSCQTASKADPQYASKVDPSTLCSRTGGEARSGQLAQRVAA